MMSPMKTVSVKLDEELERSLLEVATRRQEIAGERVTVSDVIRDMLKIGTANVDGLGMLIARDVVPSTMLDEHALDGYLVDISEPYVPVGRRCLLPVEKGANEYEPFRRGMSTKSYVIPRRGQCPDGTFFGSEQVPEMIVEGEDVHVPFFEIATNPTWHIRDGLAREPEIVSRAKESLSRQEDCEIFKTISNAVPSAHTLTVAGTATPDNFDVSCRLIWEHEVKVETVLCHPYRITSVNEWAEWARGGDWPLEQSIDDVTILSSTMCPRDTIFVMASPAMVGRIRIGIDVTVFEANEYRRMRYGRLVWESIGVCVINDYCLSKITVV